MKKKLITFICALLLTAGFAAIGFPASADEPLQPRILNLNQTVRYGYLFNPSGIFAGEKDIYVALKNGGVEIYDEAFAKTSALDISARKLAEYNGRLITLEDGVLDFDGFVLTGVGDFSLSDHTLYTAAADKISVYELTDESAPRLTQTFTAAGDVLQMGAGGDFYTVDCGVNYDADAVYRLENGANRLIAELTGKADRIISAADELYVLSESSIKLMRNNGGQYETEKSYFSGSIKDFCVKNDLIYILTAQANIETLQISSFVAPATVLASASDEDYFYNRPASATTRYGELLVCDRLNDRVAVISDDGVSYLTCQRPIAAAIDNDGCVYVLNANGVIKFSGTEESASLSVTGGRDIRTDGDGNIYVLTEGGGVTLNAALERTGQPFSAELIGICGGKPAIYDGVSVTLDGAELCEAEGLSSFAVDIQRRVFAVADGQLRRFADGVWTTLGEAAGRIELSGIETGFLHYGDLLVCDTDRHAICVFDRKTVGAADIGDLYEVPVRAETEEASVITRNIVSETTKLVKLFSSPAESVVVKQLGQGDQLFVDYSVACPDQFAYVLYDDAVTKTLTGGYIYKDALSEPLPYVAGETTLAKINNAGTPVYKWPSPFAPKVKGQTKSKNDIITIVDFAVNFTDEYGKKWFTDAYGKKWYRTAVDAAHEGFVKASDVSVNYYSDAVMPDTNAVITEYAMLYIYDSSSGQYVAFNGNTIAKDTRVKVEVPFDSSQKYTKIIFRRDGYGTIDINCYVETKYVEYDGVDMLQLVAIIIITATVVLAAVLIVLRVRRNKKRLQKARDRDIDADI